MEDTKKPLPLMKKGGKGDAIIMLVSSLYQIEELKTSEYQTFYFRNVGRAGRCNDIIHEIYFVCVHRPSYFTHIRL
ncbi:hypothetical protein CIRMBP1310_01071 [Enterococcus cecorum]|uniref:hypothetical protein n=1 Tax=Enterococcus cecorum TaxID=44008 RepID=UPI000A670D75|nr:hypothetical protein [Enterococcus cecorum]MCJ0534659.1 hypothetical protein [Enterococcus cecorum]MCJ0556297.1 hypothetical protein [Enterococcus cecorum]MDZ5546682.1 hypothetical protein [Enterococcus cecorum]MDZ5581854.1 hypothetical protein [Enterococcus cecorum]MDZ5592634.1 hypothetical protein [Enterococcus cecorum]